MDLKSVVEKYPESLNSAEKLRAYLTDLYPNEKAKVGIVVSIFSCGIAEEIERSKTIDDVTIERFCTRLENDYGYSSKLSRECIDLWLKVYDKVVASEGITQCVLVSANPVANSVNPVASNTPIKNNPPFLPFKLPNIKKIALAVVLALAIAIVTVTVLPKIDGNSIVVSDETSRFEEIESSVTSAVATSKEQSTTESAKSSKTASPTSSKTESSKLQSTQKPSTTQRDGNHTAGCPFANGANAGILAKEIGELMGCGRGMVDDEVDQYTHQREHGKIMYTYGYRPDVTLKYILESHFKSAASYGSVLKEIYTDYDSSGNITYKCESNYNQSGEVTNQISFSYNSKGIVTSSAETIYDSHGVSSKTYYYTYDANGNLLEKKIWHYKEDGSVGEEIRYDANGNLLEKSEW